MANPYPMPPPDRQPIFRFLSIEPHPPAQSECQCRTGCRIGGTCEYPPTQEDMLCDHCRGRGNHCHANAYKVTQSCRFEGKYIYE